MDVRPKGLHWCEHNPILECLIQKPENLSTSLIKKGSMDEDEEKSILLWESIQNSSRNVYCIIWPRTLNKSYLYSVTFLAIYTQPLSNLRELLATCTLLFVHVNVLGWALLACIQATTWAGSCYILHTYIICMIWVLKWAARTGFLQLALPCLFVFFISFWLLKMGLW